MMMLSSQRTTSDAVELLALNEDAIGRLYSTYGEVFPEMALFWQGLSQEERGHAALVRSLERDNADAVMFDPDRFRSGAIRLFTTHTEGEILAARSPGFKPVNALSIANAIERSLIESRFFEIFETDSIDMKRLLQKLRDDTREHSRVVLERWTQYRFPDASGVTS
jgi:hypothetical protein